jgi:hypothetical protein
MNVPKRPLRQFHSTSLSILVVLLIMGVVVVGCGDGDGTSPAGPSLDFSGIWSFDHEGNGKNNYGNEVGKTNFAEIVITQVGNSAMAIIDNAFLIDLAIDGSRVRGSLATEFGLLYMDFRMSDDILIGAITNTLPNNDPNIWSGIATRINERPSQEFDGNWDMNIVIGDPGCSEIPAGTTDVQCLTLTVSGNTVYFFDDDALVAGVGNGSSVTLFSDSVSGRLKVELLLGENGRITGQGSFRDFENQCTINMGFDGTKRTSPCSPLAVGGDFDGS